MFTLILQVLWIGFPSLVANVSAALSAKFLPNFKYPIDFYKTFKGKRVFGEHKTIRGLLIGIFAGELTFLLQVIIFRQPFFHGISIIRYNILPWYFGFVFGIGALGGDMVKSFFKRQLGIQEGVSWFPFDQIDFILGTLVILYLFISISWQVIVAGILIGVVLHIVIKFIGFTLGIGNKPI